MPSINIVLSEEHHASLQSEYREAVTALLRDRPQAAPPAFEQWLGKRIAAGNARPDATESAEVRTVHALEKFVIGMQSHGFALAHIAVGNVSPEHSSGDFAQALVADLKLPPHYQKRLQDLFTHYVKTARDVANNAYVGVTNRAYGALNETYRQLVERTAGALEHLGEERAIGRVEGGIAILLGLDVIDRDTAKEKTDAFKRQAREAARPGWMEKVFGGGANRKK